MKGKTKHSQHIISPSFETRFVRLSIISEMTEPEEISERDITYNSEQTSGTNDTGRFIVSNIGTQGLMGHWD